MYIYVQTATITCAIAWDSLRGAQRDGAHAGGPVGVAVGAGRGLGARGHRLVMYWYSTTLVWVG